jgi:hypothetical protein
MTSTLTGIPHKASVFDPKSTVPVVSTGIPHMTVLFESPPDDFGGFRAPRRPAWFVRHETDRILGPWPPQNPAASS